MLVFVRCGGRPLTPPPFFPLTCRSTSGHRRVLQATRHRRTPLPEAASATLSSSSRHSETSPLLSCPTDSSRSPSALGEDRAKKLSSMSPRQPPRVVAPTPHRWHGPAPAIWSLDHAESVRPRAGIGLLLFIHFFKFMNSVF
jgi:hypothetical protein